MRTYFARHGSHLNIDRATYDRMWDEGLVGAHYPVAKSGWSDERDADSTDPGDYDGIAGQVLSRMETCGTEGGYVCAVYKYHSGCMIGLVEPGTPIQITEGRWESVARTAKLKTLQLTKVQRLSSADSLALLSSRPRQGTFARWHKVGDQVTHLVERTDSTPSVYHLTTTQQEVLCSEFLRTDLAEEHRLPKFQSLLLPVGRTLRDVDIYGLDFLGAKVFVQVTNHSLDSDQSRSKLKRLHQYAGPDSELVMFCRTNEPRVEGAVKIFPLEKAFDVFTRTGEGKAWLKTVLLAH